jgi:hypothetical protein
MKAQKLISNGVLYNAGMFCTKGSLLWEETHVSEWATNHTFSHTTTANHGDRTRAAQVRSQCATRTPVAHGGCGHRQWMLTPPRHLTPPLINSEARVCLFSNLHFVHDLHVLDLLLFIIYAISSSTLYMRYM